MLGRCDCQVLVRPVQLVHNLGEAPLGGQILVDAPTFNAINNLLPQLGQEADPHPDYEAIQMQLQ